VSLLGVADTLPDDAQRLTPSDPNPILDGGCPKSAGGLESVVSLSLALETPVELSPLDCEPFFHGYGTECSDARLTIGIWYLSLVDLNGNLFKLPFYIVQGPGPLLVGNSILRHSEIKGPENLLKITPAAGLSKSDLVLQTYTTGNLRTHLFVVPSRKDILPTFFSSVSSFTSSALSLRSKPSNARDFKRFAYRLHGATHLSLKDMETLCKRSQVWTTGLQQSLRNAISSCESCARTGRPKISRKVSPSAVSRSFNSHVQVDFFYIEDLDPRPILHIRDASTGLSSCTVQASRDMDLTACMFEMNWIHIHGPPIECSGDPEFDNTTFKACLSKHSIDYKPRPARRHQKTGIVESGHGSIKLMSRRLSLDVAQNFISYSRKPTFAEIISHATYLRNLLYGSRTLSSFEQARGYQPSVLGLPQFFINKDLIQAHEEQVSRRILTRILRSREPSLLSRSILAPGTPVYFYVRATKTSSWQSGYVAEALPEYVAVRRQPQARGQTLKIAYEDLRLAPKSSLLQELDKLELEDTTPDDPETSSEQTLWTIQKALLVSEPHIDSPSRDIGTEFNVDQSTPPSVENLQDAEQIILRQIQDVIGNEDVSPRQLELVPSWLLEKAVNVEKTQYLQACQPFPRREVPSNSNILSSHHFFNVKKASDGLKLKCRLVPHGHRDREKEGLRTDSSTAQFPTIRLLLSLAVLYRFSLSSIDISGAYLQAGPLPRLVFIRPPRGWDSPNVLWKLLRPAYGLVESGRLWQRALAS
jgi:hypothetical protein